MKKQDTIELLQKQLPGFYSVDQVIELINGIEEESSNKLTVESMQVLRNNLLREITNELDELSASDIVDFSSASMSLTYDNTVEIDSMDFENNPFEGAVENGINKVLHDFFEPLEN